MAENADSALMMTILKEIRKEVRDVRTVCLQTVDQVRRLERVIESRFGAVDQSLAAANARFGAAEARVGAVDQRIADLKDDLELMIKSEIMGAMTNFENRVETRLDHIEQHLRLADGPSH